MGDLHHQGYGSSSRWGLYNTYTNKNYIMALMYFWQQRYHVMCHTHRIPFFGISTVKCTTWTNHILDTAEIIECQLPGAVSQTLLTCIWSSEEEKSGYGATGSPIADTSHPLEWHSLCLGNLSPFPGHRMLLHWHLCPHLSPNLEQGKKKTSKL